MQQNHNFHTLAEFYQWLYQQKPRKNKTIAANQVTQNLLRVLGEPEKN